MDRLLRLGIGKSFSNTIVPKVNERKSPPPRPSASGYYNASKGNKLTNPLEYQPLIFDSNCPSCTDQISSVLPLSKSGEILEIEDVLGDVLKNLKSFKSDKNKKLRNAIMKWKYKNHKKLQEKNNECDRLSKVLDNQSRESSKQINKLKGVISQLKIKFEDLENLNKSQTIRVDELESNNESLKKTVLLFEEKLESNNKLNIENEAQILSQLQEIERLKKINEENNKSLADAIHSNVNLKNGLKKSQEKRRVLENNIEDLDTQLKKCNNAHENIQSIRENKLKNKLEKLKTSVSLLQVKEESNKHVISRYELEMTKQRAKIKEYFDIFSMAKRRTDIFHKTLKSFQNTKTSLEIQEENYDQLKIVLQDTLADLHAIFKHNLEKFEDLEIESETEGTGIFETLITSKVKKSSTKTRLNTPDSGWREKTRKLADSMLFLNDSRPKQNTMIDNRMPLARSSDEFETQPERIQSFFRLFVNDFRSYFTYSANILEKNYTTIDIFTWFSCLVALLPIFMIYLFLFSNCIQSLEEDI